MRLFLSSVPRPVNCVYLSCASANRAARSSAGSSGLQDFQSDKKDSELCWQATGEVHSHHEAAWQPSLTCHQFTASPVRTAGCLPQYSGRSTTGGLGGAVAGPPSGASPGNLFGGPYSLQLWHLLILHLLVGDVDTFVPLPYLLIRCRVTGSLDSIPENTHKGY